MSENHNIKYNPLFASQSSIDSFESEIDDQDEFWDFDEKLGLGVECRRKRRNEAQKRCTYCTKIVPQITEFISQTGENHVIRQSLFCDSKNVIYLATCKKCNLSSVGSSINFKNRLQSYKRNILERIGDTAFETHMRKIHSRVKDPLSIVEIVPIRKYDPRTHNASHLRAHETLWMNRLNTLEKGLNKREEKSICSCVDYEREESLILNHLAKSVHDTQKEPRRSPRNKKSVNYK
ncbi:Oidioi.mRNA.OKI2018_I69.chr1.g813.t1.cds [Oikopleura dioica]|uniref:Oidioi.mRNA.OKI2018_I69.chr1.g813.t1.cds n=1 Tax=Oikopleura dioica TaxID=34765 RepID=A0ABN7SL11_OIKDI|nr:Oidioi.mRNA.OKI2018_I69.chr1.g813.t1.cds [Oikopleura dioica]